MEGRIAQARRVVGTKTLRLEKAGVIQEIERPVELEGEKGVGHKR